ncbi:MAG: DNA polymerase III subunit gamma/tau [Pseudomonadota bacterium]
MPTSTNATSIHIALARKWRPKTFAEMVGQSHIVTALQNALNANRLHHAYLFSGTRGVGKTTLGRILAKCLNCESGITANPCGTCSACVEIDGGCFIDLFEIDAASRTKVEDTRELLENVKYAPTRGRFKIYLIDEVHMLSNHSFNALLKTLEEPPAHVKFILATTDPQKLPVTVLSRCLQFHLKYLLPETLKAHLIHISKTEKLSANDTALGLIAQAARGSVRDSLSLLDQAIALADTELNADLVHQMLGTTHEANLYPVLDALIANDAKQLLEQARNLLELGVDFTLTTDSILQLLHNIALAQALKENVKNLYSEKICHYATQISAELVQLYYQIALTSRNDLELAPNAQMGFEMMLLRMLHFQPLSPVTPESDSSNNRSNHAKQITTTVETNQELHLQPLSPATPESDSSNNRSNHAKQITTISPTTPTTTEVSQQNHQVVPTATVISTNTKPMVNAQAEPQTIPAKELQSSAQAQISAPSDEWETILAQLQLSPMTRALAQHCHLKSVQNQRLTLLVTAAQKPLLNANQINRLEVALAEYFNKPIKLNLEEVAEIATTPAKNQQMRADKAKKAAIDNLNSDPSLQNLIQSYNAKIDINSIELINDEDPNV